MSMLWTWCVSLALAGPTDFSGTWVLDAAASDDMSPMMEAQGIPGWQQSIAKRMGISQKIVDHGELVEIVYKASVFSEQHDVRADGVKRAVKNKRGFVEEQLHVRQPDGSIESEVRWTTTSGVPVVVRVHRFLDESGKTMVLANTIQLGDDAPVPIKRVFRKDS